MRRSSANKDPEIVETGPLTHLSDDTNTTRPSGANDLAHLFDLPQSNGSNHFEASDLPDWEEEEVSQPSTPKVQVARPAKNARSSLDRSIGNNGIHKQHGNPKKSRLASSAGKMLRPQQHQDIWTCKMDTTTEHFNLALPPNGLHSPPPSTKLLQGELADSFFARDHSQPCTIALSPPLYSNDPTTSPNLQNNYQLTPLSSPAIDTNSSRNGSGNPFQFSNDSMASAYISHHLSNSAALSALQTPPPSHGLSMSAWGADTPPNLGFDNFSASPDFSSANGGGNGKAEGWWNGPAVSQPDVSYQPAHSRSTSRNLSFTTASVAGLGISCDSASFSGFGEELSSSDAASSFDMPPYSSLYAPITPGIPISTSPANLGSSSRSPSLSPQPRFTRRRHPSYPPSHHHSQHMQAHSSRTTHRRKSSNSSTQSRSASQSTSSGGGFVNFTPSDSRKILTGVAPSGSSKTKARREKEAADKRRKLNQAAVRAVVEAGGDLGRLEKEILVLES
ncbi:hypothetical protein K458DRAFT_387172 [Lentithecium fluviatile CBS 122367]|uniref:Uncharacterized protein n=1 Tax=Lentithecium fluviatile CBS 122367 TaxID=1168545 RepID=A0A6G1J6M8_9PLEO|nr:hypothetical protein K458DRAFT_387172 [Lentithecium fluviatile CBS 122367]